MNKRGISGIVVTVLLVLIAVGALGILWIVILTFINSGSENIDIGTNTLKVNIVENSLKYLPGDSIELLVKRDSIPGNISGVKVVIDSEGGNSFTVDANVKLDVLESKKIIVPLNGQIDKITKVSVYPLISSGTKTSVGKFSDDEIIDSHLISDEGLVMYLPFDGDMLDKSGNGNDGSCIGNNCPLSSAGKIGDGYSFDGLDDNISVGDDDTLDFSTNNFSAIMWIKQNTPAVNPRIIAKPHGIGTISWEFFVYSTNNNLVFRTNTNLYESSVGSFPFGNNIWHQVGFVINRDTDVISIYVDGEKVGYPIFPDSRQIFSNTASLYIGNRVYDDSPFNGGIDEVRLYNRGLTDKEVYYLYKYN